MQFDTNTFTYLTATLKCLTLTLTLTDFISYVYATPKFGCGHPDSGNVQFLTAVLDLIPETTSGETGKLWTKP